MMQSLLVLFKKPAPKAKGKIRRCVVYDDLGCFSRNLFDEDFPTSSSLQANLGHTVRGVRIGVDSTVECKPDGTVFASATPEVVPRYCRVAAKVEGNAANTRGVVIAGLSQLPMLPGFSGEVDLSNKTQLCRLKTQYRHKYFSVLTEGVFKEDRDLGVTLSGVGRSACVGFAAGVVGKMNLKKVEGRKFYDCALESLDGRINFSRRQWSIFLESSHFGRDYSLSVLRRMFVPHFTNEMVIAARLTAHAALPDLKAAKTVKEKAQAVNAALTPKATFAVRTKLTEFSSAKIKVDTKGMVGFSFAEQLSQYARAVFAVNVDATNLKAANNNKFAFTLTLEH